MHPACPKCGWSDVRLSRREGLGDFLARLAWLAPLRCRKCRLRFYRPWFIAAQADKLEPDALSVPPLARMIALTAPSAAPPPPLSLTPANSILLLDEDRDLRRLLVRLLRRDGYLIREAEYPRDAMCELAAGRVDLLIANLHRDHSEHMLREVRDAYPSLKILELADAGMARASAVVDRVRQLLHSPDRVQ
jgi:CheY-like chemotaxis protein